MKILGILVMGRWTSFDDSSSAYHALSADCHGHHVNVGGPFRHLAYLADTLML